MTMTIYQQTLLLVGSLPSNPLQPGPINFLTLQKCAIFGVCCEAVPRQFFY